MKNSKLDLNQIRDRLPRHVAIIMDGNRRWARAKGLDILKGHDYVVDNTIEPIVDRCIELEIPYLTLWAFSTENWRRSAREVNGLMRIFRKVLNQKMEDLMKKEVRLKTIGDLSKFPKDIRERANDWMEKSKDNKKITVILALNYGGRDEIVRAVKKVWEDVSEQNKLRNSHLSPNEITNLILSEDFFEKYLDTAGMPDPDLIIRTGGAQRTSGFMPWQSVYSELYFTETYMPDFTVDKFDEALIEFMRRERRFGR